jgi:hypothetical protein
VSPSEFDLRAALHEGEGDRLDPDSVLAAARGARRERRVRLASVAGAVLVVGGIGAGVGISNLRSSPGPNADGGPANTFGTHHGPNVPTGSRPTTSVQAVLHRITCPRTPVQLALPGGGGTNQFGAHSSLFGQPVAAIKVCVYRSLEGTHPRSLVLWHAAAQELATSLDSAPTSLGGRMCPDHVLQNQVSFEFLAVTPAGDQLPPVTATPGCRGRVTNGTGVRIGWSPPSSLSRVAAIPTN